MDAFLSFLMRMLCLDPADPNATVALSTWAGVIIAGIALIALFSVGIRQVKQLRQESHRQLLMTLMQNWDSDSMISAIKSFWELEKSEADRESLTNKLYTAYKNRDDSLYCVIKIANYFETIGLMLNNKNDRKLVKELISDVVINYYSTLQDWINKSTSGLDTTISIK